RFAKVEKHSISLELALQKCKEHVKNDTVCNEKASNVFRNEREQYFEIQDLKAQLQDKNIAISELKKLIERGKGKSVDTKFDRPSIVRQPNAQRIPKPSVLGKPIPFSDSLERKYFSKKKSVPKTNVSKGLSKPVTTQTLPQTAKKAVSNTNVLKPGMYRIDNRTVHTRAPQLPQTVSTTNPRVSTSTGVNHNTNVSKPQLKSNQSRDKVLLNNSQVKAKKTQVDVHLKIPSVSNKMKSVTACKDSLNSRKLNANVICATCNKCLVDSNYFSCVTKMLNDVHARTRKPTVVPISTRKPKSQANKSVATHHKQKVASKPTDQKLQSYFRVLKKKLFQVKGCSKFKRKATLLYMDSCGPMRVASINRKNYILVIVDDYSRYTWTFFLRSKDETPEVLKDFLTTIQRNLQAPMITIPDADVPSQQELDLLFGPLYDEFFNAGSNPSTNIQSTSAPSTHTNMHAEENNNDQAEEGEQLQDDEFTNLFCAPTQEVVEYSSHNNLQTRRQLATDPEMCMYALTLSTTEPKNIKEAMAHSAWIEAMHEELHKFDRLQHMTGNLKLICNFVEKFLGTVRFGNDQFAPILGYGDLVQGNVTINRVYYVEGVNYNRFSVGQFCDADLEVAFKKSTCFVRDLQGNDLLIGNFRSDLYTISPQESTSSTPLCLMAKATPTQAWLWHRRLSHLNFDYVNLLSKKDIMIGLPKLKYGENLDKMKEKRDQCILVGYSTQSKGYRIYNKRKRMMVESIHIRFDEIKEVSKTFVANNTLGLVPQRQKASDYDNPDPSTSAPSTHTNMHDEENHNDQAEEGEQLQDDEFTNLLCAPTQEVSEYRWTKYHPLEQVRGNPSRPVQTRRQLATHPEMCMYALTLSTTEPKNIKEAMADSAWIEAMQEELHQFDRL
nr:integrase, catalytic region, zinc finger, CCHC-type, peptidase aspartic, catalytic [Tanacetum cinerariifolium]